MSSFLSTSEDSAAMRSIGGGEGLAGATGAADAGTFLTDPTSSTSGLNEGPYPTVSSDACAPDAPS